MEDFDESVSDASAWENRCGDGADHGIALLSGIGRWHAERL